jgi:hypothetical protein
MAVGKGFYRARKRPLKTSFTNIDGKHALQRKKKKRSKRIKKENLLLLQLTRAREKWREGSGRSEERRVGKECRSRGSPEH